MVSKSKSHVFVWMPIDIEPKGIREYGLIAIHSGALGLIGHPGEAPVPPLNLLGDFAGGAMTTAFGIVCALLERERSGLGQVIDGAMVEGSALLATMFHELIAMGGHDESQRGTNVLDGGAPYYDVYETADARWFVVGAVATVLRRTSPWTGPRPK